MSELKRKHGEQPIYTFKQKMWEKALLAGLILFIGVMVSTLLTDFTFEGENNLMVLGFMGFFLFIFAYLIVIIFMALNIKTDIYENGFGVQHGNSYTFTTWDNLRYFEVRKVGKSTIVGIVTYEPVERRVPGGFIERLLHYKGDMHFMEVGAVNIPTKFNGLFSLPVVDEAKLATTDFGHYLLEYAPDLFTEYKVK